MQFLNRYRYVLLILLLCIVLPPAGNAVRVNNIEPYDQIEIPEKTTPTKISTLASGLASKLEVKVLAKVDGSPLLNTMVFLKRNNPNDVLYVHNTDAKGLTEIDQLKSQSCVVIARDGGGTWTAAKVDIQPGYLHRLTLTMPYECLVDVPIPPQSGKYNCLFSATRFAPFNPMQADADRNYQLGTYSGRVEGDRLKMSLPEGDYSFLVERYEKSAPSNFAERLYSDRAWLKPGLTSKLVWHQKGSR